MTRDDMTAIYHANTAAEGYCLGFVYRHTIYRITLSQLPDSIIKLDRCSSKKGGWAKLRIRLRKAAKLDLIAMGAQAIGPEELLREDSRHNKGENFERIVTEAAGQIWKKDRVPFTVAGDLVLHGKQIQVKLEGAELTNEKTLRNLALA